MQISSCKAVVKVNYTSHIIGGAGGPWPPPKFKTLIGKLYNGNHLTLALPPSPQLLVAFYIIIMVS